MKVLFAVQASARLSLLAAAMLLGSLAMQSGGVLPPGAVPSGAAQAQTVGIVAVVNGDVITRADVDNRRRLFALSIGLPVTQEVLDRLTPQVIRDLTDERLRLQEIQRRKIVVPDKEIATSLNDIESRNNLPSGALRNKLGSAGVELRTLIDQLRMQLGWTRVVREELGDRGHITDAEVAEQQALLKAESGRTEYRLAEIFIPVDDAAHEPDAQRFADTVIQQLRAGAPFAVVAAQFSQSQSAQRGGDLGWVQPNEVDPGIAKVITEMPDGAVSNPTRVPGGLSIVTLHGKRQIGNEVATILSIRTVYLPFSSPLNQRAPTDQQKQALERARAVSAGTHSCAAMEEANRTAGSARPADPGEVRLEGVNPPQFRQMLANMPLDHASQPLVAADGISIAMVCARDQKNVGVASKEEIANRLAGDRAELLSRQMLRDLRRRASIELRS